MVQTKSGRSAPHARADGAKRKAPRDRRGAETQRAARRTRRRRIRALGVTAIAAFAVIIGVVALAGRSAGASGQALYQFNTADFHSLAFDPTDANTVYFGHHGGLNISHDGGKHWEETALQHQDAMQLGTSTGDASRRYVAGHDLFRVSTDGGKTWRDQPTNLPGLDLHAFAASPTNALRLYAAPVSQGLFTSTDGGARWQPATMPSLSGGGMGMIGIAVAYDDPLHLYAGGGNRVVESKDGGKTWQELSAPPGAVTQLAVGPSGALYAGTDRGLAKRGADGLWQIRALPSGKPAVALAVGFMQPERVAVIDEHGRFYRSDNGGMSWV